MFSKCCTLFFGGQSWVCCRAAVNVVRGEGTGLAPDPTLCPRPAGTAWWSLIDEEGLHSTEMVPNRNPSWFSRKTTPVA